MFSRPQSRVGLGPSPNESTTAWPTYGVAALCGEVREILEEAYRGVWVVGELHRGRRSQNGHFYFELVEKGRGDEIIGKLDAVIWRKDFERVARVLEQAEQQLDEGQQLRCWGQLDFYPPTGRLQMVVRELDPLHTLGQLERRRRETLAALEREGLIGANALLPLSPLPLRLGLVTSKESAAYHDFLTGLKASGLGFKVLLVHAAMQGARAELEVASALELLAEARLSGGPLDALVIVRGGGSRSDLAAFDSRQVARAVAVARLPVLCGLGHEIDRTITDLVCHSSLKTPTMVAEFLCRRVLDQETRLDQAERRLGAAAGVVLKRSERELRRFERLPELAARRLETARRRLEENARALSRQSARRLRESERRLGELSGRLAQAAPRLLARKRPLADDKARNISRRVQELLRRHEVWLDGAARLCQQVAPERLLERGYSITRNAEGTLVRHPDQVRSGEELTTTTAGGRIRSRVEGGE